jgi:hypothetical protein
MSVLLQKFRNTLIEFVTELSDQFPDESDIKLIRMVLPSFPIEVVMKHFISKLLPHKKEVDNRDEQFFLDNDVLYVGVANSTKVDYFKTLWVKLDSDTRDTVFDWFSVLLKIVEEYVKQKNV